MTVPQPSSRDVTPGVDAFADAVCVAVDGGNSKTELVVVGLDGTERARVIGPGSGGGPDAVATVVAALLAEYAVDPESVVAIAAAVAGLDFPGDENTYVAALARLLPRARVAAFNDAVAVLDAGARLGDAVAIVCGAGLNVVARGAAGLQTVPALGWPSGDWGGGDDLGREAVRAGYRAADGRGPATVLEQRILEALALSSFPDVARAIRDGSVSGAQVGALAELVAAAAAEGDGPATALMRRAVDEVVALVDSVTSRAWPRGTMPQATPAVLAGGIFSDPRFRAAVEQALATRGFAPFVLGHRPVDGVVLAALDLAAVAPASLAPASSGLSGATVAASAPGTTT